MVRVGSFSFGMPSTYSDGSSSDRSSKKSDNLEVPSRISRNSIASCSSQPQESSSLKDEIEMKDKEICSYKKTIETLSEELDELRSRVRDLEQIKRESAGILAREKEGKREEREIVEELRKEVNAEKSEKEIIRYLLQEESEKVSLFI